MHKKFLRTFSVLVICASSWSTTMEAMEETILEVDERTPLVPNTQRRQDVNNDWTPEYMKHKWDSRFEHYFNSEENRWMLKVVSFRRRGWDETRAGEEEITDFVVPIDERMGAPYYTWWFEGQIGDTVLKRMSQLTCSLRRVTRTDSVWQNPCITMGGEQTGFTGQGLDMRPTYAPTYLKPIGSYYRDQKVDLGWSKCENCGRTTDKENCHTPETKLKKDQKRKIAQLVIYNGCGTAPPCHAPKLVGEWKVIWDQANQNKNDNNSTWNGLLGAMWSAAREMDKRNGYQDPENWRYEIQETGCCSIL